MFRFAIRVPAHKSDDGEAAIPRPGPSAAQPLPPLLHIDWSLLPPMPAGVEGQSGGFVDSTTLVRHQSPTHQRPDGCLATCVCRQVYAFGLSHKSYPGCLNTSYFLDISQPPARRAWRPLPPVNAPPRQSVSATTVGGDAYFVGGFDNRWQEQGARQRTSGDAVRLSRDAAGGWRWEPTLPPPL